MIRSIIIDDEEDAIETLEILISSYCPDVVIEGKASNISEGEDLIAETSPDLIFLDINMPNGTGFDLMEKYKGNAQIVFTTAHGKHAIQALRLSAFDFLLKPISKNDLINCVDRFDQAIATKQADSIEVLRELLNEDQKPKRITIAEKDGHEVITLSDLIYCEAAKSYTIFHLSDGRKKVASKSINEYEGLLPDDLFLRIHRSFLVNSDHIKKFKKGQNGEVTLSDDTILEVSRRKKTLLSDFFS